MPDARRRDLRRWHDRRRRRGPAGALTGGLAVVAVASAIVLATAPGASAPTGPATSALAPDGPADRQDAASRSAERTDEAEPAAPQSDPTSSDGAEVAPDPAPDGSGPAAPGVDGAASGGDGAAAPAPAPAPGPAAEPEPQPAAAVASADDPGAAMAADVVTLTNQRRGEAGLAPLGVSACATEQAVARAGVLVAEGRFEHDPLGPVLDACRAGTVGENLSLGYPSAQAAVAGWMGSPGHRENILRASYAQVGVGCVPGGRGWLCAQVFVG